MRSVSKIFRKQLAAAIGERDFFLRLDEQKERLESVTNAMNSPFGAALIEALENIEANSYNTLAETSVVNIPKVLQAKAELKVARYLKAKLLTYVADLDAINEQLALLYPQEEEN